MFASKTVQLIPAASYFVGTLGSVIGFWWESAAWWETQVAEDATRTERKYQVPSLTFTPFLPDKSKRYCWEYHAIHPNTKGNHCKERMR